MTACPYGARPADQLGFGAALPAGFPATRKVIVIQATEFSSATRRI